MCAGGFLLLVTVEFLKKMWMYCCQFDYGMTQCDDIRTFHPGKSSPMYFTAKSSAQLLTLCILSGDNISHVSIFAVLFRLQTSRKFSHQVNFWVYGGFELNVKTLCVHVMYMRMCMHAWPPGLTCLWLFMLSRVSPLLFPLAVQWPNVLPLGCQDGPVC